MTATVSQILDGLKNRLVTISGLRALDYVPDDPNPPIAIPAIDLIDYHRAFAGGGALHEITVSVIVGAASERTAQARLDGYLAFSGSQSIRAAIEADTTLGGVAQTAVVSSADGIGNIVIGTTKYLVANFKVTVYA